MSEGIKRGVSNVSDSWKWIVPIIISILGVSVNFVSVLVQRKGTKKTLKQERDQNANARKQSHEDNEKALKQSQEALESAKHNSEVANNLSAEITKINVENELRNRVVTHVVLQSSMGQDKLPNKQFRVVDLQNRYITMVDAYPLKVNVITGTVATANQIIAYFPMTPEESGGFQLNGLPENGFVNVGDGWNILEESTKASTIRAVKDDTNTGRFKAEFTPTKIQLFPKVATGFQISFPRLIFAQSYILTGADGTNHLLMYWYDSEADGGKTPYGYLSAIRGIANNDMRTPQWAQFQFQRLYSYLSDHAYRLYRFEGIGL